MARVEVQQHTVTRCQHSRRRFARLDATSLLSAAMVTTLYRLCRLRASLRYRGHLRICEPSPAFSLLDDLNPALGLVNFRKSA